MPQKDKLGGKVCQMCDAKDPLYVRLRDGLWGAFCRGCCYFFARALMAALEGVDPILAERQAEELKRHADPPRGPGWPWRARRWHVSLGAIFGAGGGGTPLFPEAECFRTILCDPPWRYDNFGQAKHGAARAHYSTMTLEGK
jgi:hypothetical protein